MKEFVPYFGSAKLFKQYECLQSVQILNQYVLQLSANVLKPSLAYESVTSLLCLYTRLNFYARSSSRQLILLCDG